MTPSARSSGDRILTGKCALITGSTQGLGLVVAKTLGAAGCHVVLNGFGEAETMEAVRRDIETRFGVRAAYCAADLSVPVEIERMMADSIKAFGCVDVLVNNAVVRHAAPIDEFPVEQWTEALAVNLSAAFHTIRLALPAMRAKQWGRIVNVSSIYGLRGAPNRVGYVTTKTALLGLTRAVALEGLPHNITCNAVCPGTTESPVHEATMQQLMQVERISHAEAERRFMTGKQPTGRIIQAEQVAALILFLCGPNSANITGAALPIDDAWSAS